MYELNPLIPDGFCLTNTDRVEALEETYVKSGWFKQIDSGTSGTLSAVAEIGTSAEFLADCFGSDVDMVVSTVTAGQKPDYEPALTAAGVIVTATFNAGTGAWALSGTPASYPVALLYGYRQQFKYFDESRSLNETELTGKGDHANLVHLNWADAGHLIDTSIDVNYQQLLRSAIHQGLIADIPVTGNEVEGNGYLATDICTLFLYCDGQWKPQQSFDAVNIYVDETNGTDAVGKGYASGTGAVKTRAYAVGLIPPLSGGNVTINMPVGTFTDISCPIQGKAFSGPYSITWLGTLPAATDSGTASSATQYSMGAAGAGASQATLVDSTKAWTVGSIVLGSDGADYICIKAHTSAASNRPVSGTATVWKYFWLYLGTRGLGAAWASGVNYGASQFVNKLLVITGGTGSGQERVIDFNSSGTTLKVVGLWDTTPDATSTYAIYDLSTGTVIDGTAGIAGQSLFELTGQQNVYFKYIYFTEAPTRAIYAHDFSSFGLDSCVFYRNRTTAGMTNIRMIDVRSSSSLIRASSVVWIENVTNSINSAVIFQQSFGLDFKNSKTQGCNATFPISTATYCSMYGMVIRNSRLSGVQPGQFSRLDFSGSVIYNSVTGVAQTVSSTFTISNNVQSPPSNLSSEISLCSGNGITTTFGANSQFLVTTIQINYNAGWGFNGSSGGTFTGTGYSFTGNTSGSFITYLDDDNIKMGYLTDGATSTVEINALSATVRCGVGKAFASQSTNIWEWQKSDATIYSGVDNLGNPFINDNSWLALGTGQDAQLWYDGTDLNIDPKAVGTGAINVLGDMVFSGSGNGLPYGGMYHNTAFTVSVAVANTAYEADDGANAFTASPLNLTTFSDHYVSVDKAGTYEISYSVAVSLATLSGGASDDIEAGIMVDGSANAQGKSHTTVSVQNHISHLGCGGILTLTAGQQISLYVMNHTDTDDITVEHLGMKLTMVGG